MSLSPEGSLPPRSLLNPPRAGNSAGRPVRQQHVELGLVLLLVVLFSADGGSGFRLVRRCIPLALFFSFKCYSMGAWRKEWLLLSIRGVPSQASVIVGDLGDVVRVPSMEPNSHSVPY
jgi:hypothetical protein